MVPTKTYGWKLATFRLPTGVYTFEVKNQKVDEPSDSIELELKVNAPVEYMGHRVRAFVLKNEWQYPQVFSARLADDYGIIVPDTVQKLR